MLRSAEVSPFEKGQPGRTWKLTDAQLHAVSDWLAERSSGWTPAPGTYAPALLISGLDADQHAYTLDVRSDQIIINAPNGQYVKQFPSEELSALRRLLGADP